MLPVPVMKSPETKSSNLCAAIHLPDNTAVYVQVGNAWAAMNCTKI
jgi:hypothetical protein